MRYFKVLFLTFVVLTLFVNCQTTKYLPVEQTSDKEIERWRTDSIHITDSIFVFVKGDTIYQTRWRDRYHDRVVQDTVFLQETIPKIVEVERDFTFWERIKIKSWSILLSVIVILFLFFIIKMAFKKWFGA